MNGKNIIEVRNVTMRFGGVTAVSGLDMNIPEGGIVGLIGPNGAGKTTVFNVITGFYRPTEGDVVFAGRRITGMAPHAICSLGMARTFQNIRLFYNETALENVMIGRHVRRKSRWWGSVLGLPGTMREERDIREKSRQLLERIGLSAYAGEVASGLPYGAQRRLEIARALATEPKLLLLDETMAGLSGIERQDATALIRQIHARGVTILMIEHVMEIVMNVSDKVVVLNGGKLLMEGTPKEVASNAEVISAYLGGTTW